MAENDAQRNAIMYGISALTRHFKDRRDVYVSGDLLIYYEEGNPRVSIAPDVFVVFGVEKRERPNYKLWEEGRAPAFVLEVASPSTWRDDFGRNRSVYARLGVSGARGRTASAPPQAVRLTSAPRPTSVARRRPSEQGKTAAPADQFVGRRCPNGRWPSARCITSYCTPMMWPMASIQ